MPVSPGASGMQPRDPGRPWRGTLASGHKITCGLHPLQRAVGGHHARRQNALQDGRRPEELMDTDTRTLILLAMI